MIILFNGFILGDLRSCEV